MRSGRFVPAIMLALESGFTDQKPKMIYNNKIFFTSIVIVFIFISSIIALDSFVNYTHERKMRENGVHTTAKVVTIYKRKRGYDIVYEFYAGGVLRRMAENRSDYNLIRVGNCYSLLYYKQDPLIRHIDFSKAIECQQ